MTATTELRPAPPHPGLAELVRAHAAAAPGRRACVVLDLHGEEDEAVSYGELDRRARSTAAALRRVAEPGERALLMCDTGLEFVAGFLGCLYSGVIAVPVPKPDRLSSGPRHWGRIAAICRNAAPSVILTSADLVDHAEVAGLGVAQRLAVREVWSGQEAGWTDPFTPTAEPAFLQYTSGSTGDPKGAVISHGALAANLWAITEGFELGGLGPELTTVSWLPLYHDMGIVQLLLALRNGGTSVLMSQMAFLVKPLTWLQAVGRYGAQLCSAPNFAFELCVDRIPVQQRAGLDLSRLRNATCGSEPVRFDTAERFAAAFEPTGFRGEFFKPAYGLAEGTLYVSGEREPGDPRYLDVDIAAITERGVVAPPAGRGPARRMISNGRVARNLRVRIVDPETGLPCPPDRVGEIWIAGPSLASGYWRLPEVSAEKFGARPAGAHGAEGPFLRSGDLGFLRDGQLYVAGRRDDLVIVDGRNHHPRDVEITLTESHPALAPGQATVFGHEQDGRLLVVAVAETALGVRVAPPGAEAPAGSTPRTEVERAVRRAVSEEHQLGIATVVLVKPGAIPRTTSGKLQRRASRQLYLDGRLNAW
ncbi:fatty acyl-AMP ligase [Kitasatospora sp. NPDC006697]|uniref:fatty acyl-AMP ligase n=1 Tax=Kitasatospora sp. NPDC006697 TaxID=3364020 RepID=UPI0036AB2516